MAPAKSTSTQSSALRLAKTVAATHTVHANDIEGQLYVIDIVSIWENQRYASTSSAAIVWVRAGNRSNGDFEQHVRCRYLNKLIVLSQKVYGTPTTEQVEKGSSGTAGNQIPGVGAYRKLGSNTRSQGTGGGVTANLTVEPEVAFPVCQIGLSP